MKDWIRSASRSWRAVLLLPAACTALRTPPADESPAQGADPPPGTPVPWTAEPDANPFFVAAPDPDTATPVGVMVTLNDAVSRAPARPPATAARPLAAAESEALFLSLAGAPPPVDTAGSKAFRFPSRSMPAPRPGTSTRGVLPGPNANAETPEIGEAGPLRVVHTAPHGAVATASQVSVTFSRPMVPLSELQDVPPGVRLSPASRGAWRWLDPQTLVFEAAHRLPKATRYTVDVPAALVAADGEPLGEAVRWTFSTPAPTVVDVVTADTPEGLPLLVLSFDQRVDPAAVLPYLRFEVEGQDRTLRLAAADEWESPDIASQRAILGARMTNQSAPDSARMVVVRPEGRPPASTDTEIEAVLRALPGLPSLEGPERTSVEATFPLHLAPAFSVVEHGCGRAMTCWPGVPWTIRFNTQLGPQPDSGVWVRVDPPLPGATAEIWNDHLVVLGTPEPGRTYTVWLDPAVTSWSGGELGPTSPLRFSVGQPPPSIWMPGGGVVMIPPAQPARLPVLTEGVDSIEVEVRAVRAQEWPAYQRVLDTWESGFVSAVTPLRDFYGGFAPGERLSRKVLPVTLRRAGPDELVLDLEDVLEASGHAFIIAEPVVDPPARPGDGTARERIVFGWVQRSELQLEVQEYHGALTVYATSATNGRPMRDVHLELTSTADSPAQLLDSAHTDEGGLAVLRADYSVRGNDWLLRAELDGRSTMFPARLVGDWPYPHAWAPELRSHFVTDRPIYEPGDTVRFAGWLRIAAGTGREPIRPDELSYVSYEARDPRGATLAEGHIFEMSPNGRVEGSFMLPREANSGRGFVTLVVTDLTEHKLYTFLTFEVEEARRPNVDVSVEVEPGALVQGQSLEATARARYFTGGAVPDAEVRWVVSSSPAYYSPPGVSGYHFGRWARVHERIPPSEHAARTSVAGEHRLNAQVDSVQPDIAMNLTIEATVVDLDRQERTARANVLVHAANVYVGLRAAAPFMRVGEPLLVEALAVDIDGQAVAGRTITVRAMRQDRRAEPGRLVIDESERAQCELRSRVEPVQCTLEGLPAGDYLIVARVDDELGRQSASEIPIRIAGETIPSSALASLDSVTVEPDRTEYEPGDTAIISLHASFPAIEALLTVRRAGVIEAHAVKLNPLSGDEDFSTTSRTVMGGERRSEALPKSGAVVRLPIRDAHVPTVHVAVAAHTADGRTGHNSVPIRVAPRTRELDVNVAPHSAELAPGATTTITVTVKDSAGQPVPGADVVLSGIDEALVALSHRPFTDPLDDIYPRWSAEEVTDRTLRRHVAPRLAPAPQVAEAAVGKPARISPQRAAPGVERGLSFSPAAPTGMDSTGTVAGVVIDGSTGAPIAGAWIEVSGSGDTWTRLNGSYWLEGLPAGEHLLVARANGYVNRQIPDVAIEPGGFAHANVVLLTHEAVLAGGRSLTGEPMASTNAACEGCLAAHAAAIEMLPSPGEAAYRDGFELEELEVAGASWTRRGAALRRNLSPVAAFLARAVTGDDGRVEMPVEMPDNLTRYRIRAVAARGDRLFGAGESTVTVRRPLIVRPSPPRFLNQGDRFELPVLLENRSGSALEVDVAVRATNADVGAPTGRRVMIPPEDRVELRFPATAGLPGTARFQVAAQPNDPAGHGDHGADAGSIADAVEVAVPVFVPAVRETFAAYGVLDDATPVAYPLRLPGASLPGQAQVELGFATTAAHGLEDALWFLWECPFDLPETWASRILALTALTDAPAAAPWPMEVIDSAVAVNVRRLARLQLRDGGWSLWTARFDADPFVTVHAAHALARANAAGHAVPERTLTDVQHWLARVDALAADSTDAGMAAPFPIDYPRQARHAVQAYALDVRRRLGDDVSASAAALLHEAGARALPAEALAWLLPALVENSAYAAEAGEVWRELDARVVRSAGTAGIVSPYDAGGRTVFHSPRRTDAIVLDALVDVAASPRAEATGRSMAGRGEELVAALAQGLMAHRVRGRWANTQENAFAVAALARYLASAEAEEPDLRARAWAGRRLAGERAFDGRSDERQDIVIPADSLGEPGEDLELVVAREGDGRLYYRVGLSYARAGETPAAARGFEISRTYEAVDDPADVQRDDDGTWRVRRGARVRVRLTVAAPGPRYHVAIVDALPAGLEAINPALAGTSSAFDVPPHLGSGTGREACARASEPIPFCPEHVNVKSDRFEAFKSRLEGGRREIVYYALATTPGDFAAPAPRAEEMYGPETFGRGAAERLVVDASGSGMDVRQ